MAPFVLAWLVGEGIVTYRTAKATGGPPGPGQLLFSSMLFVALGIIAESPKARSLALTIAWGLDIAAFMNLAQFGTPKVTGVRWPPNQADPGQIIPDGMPAGSDPVEGHGTDHTGSDSGSGTGSGQGTASGPGGPGIG